MHRSLKYSLANNRVSNQHKYTDVKSMRSWCIYFIICYTTYPSHFTNYSRIL